MRKLFYLTIFVICLGGCSSSAPENVNIRTNVDISELNNPNVNAQPANANNVNSPKLDLEGNVKVNKIAEENKNAPPPFPNPKPLVYPAPDNSEITSSMNDKGQMLETRTFKNNPTLAKVERLYVELDKPVITAYLKNGKKVDLTAVKMDDPMKSSAEDIINRINVGKPNPVPTKQP